MHYPETLSYIKKQLEKGISPERIKKALSESGYLPDVIETLMKEAGVTKKESPSSGIESLILKDAAIGVIILLIVGAFFTMIF